MLVTFSCENFLIAPFPRLSDMLQAPNANIFAHPSFNDQESDVINESMRKKGKFVCRRLPALQLWVSDMMTAMPSLRSRSFVTTSLPYWALLLTEVW